MKDNLSCLLGCGADTRPLAPEGAGSQYLQCQGCGLAFVKDFQSAEVIARQYLEDLSSTVEYYRSTGGVDRITFQKRLQQLAALQPERGRLLDVGCNTGTLMSVATEMGWQVEGVEPNPKAAQLARQQNFQVHQGFFGSALAGQLSGGYQCVVMSDVIEHLANPLEALVLAGELLAPTGLLLLSTPNLDSFWCRKYQLKPKEHLFLFNGHNLRVLLERESFRVDHLERTSRRRALDQLIHSTTELGRGSQLLIGAICRLGLDRMFTWMMDYFFKDELLIIARKTGRKSS